MELKDLLREFETKFVIDDGVMHYAPVEMEHDLKSFIIRAFEEGEQKGRDDKWSEFADSGAYRISRKTTIDEAIREVEGETNPFISSADISYATGWYEAQKDFVKILNKMKGKV